MKVTYLTQALLNLKRVFVTYLNNKNGELISYQFTANDEGITLDFVINMSTYIHNQELINEFMQDYDLYDYIKIQSCQHIQQNNYMRTIVTFVETNDKKHRKELCGLFMIKH